MIAALWRRVENGDGRHNATGAKTVSPSGRYGVAVSPVRFDLSRVGVVGKRRGDGYAIGYAPN